MKLEDSVALNDLLYLYYTFKCLGTRYHKMAWLLYKKVKIMVSVIITAKVGRNVYMMTNCDTVNFQIPHPHALQMPP